MSWAGAVLMLTCLVAIMMFVLGRMRYPSRAASTTRGLGSYVFPEDAGRLAGGIVATQALGSVLNAFRADSATGVVLAGVAGALSAWLPEKVLKPVFGVVGIAGMLGTMYGFASDAGCTDVALPDRVGVLLVLTVSALAGAVVATVQGRLRSAAPLALFATLDILIFLEEPLGVPLFGQGWAQTLVPLAVAALLGYGGAVMPGVVIGLGALAVGFATALAGAGYGTMCSATPDFAPLTMLVLFGIGYALTRKVAARRR